jgi:hypothetical protein
MQAPGARDLTESQEFKTNALLLLYSLGHSKLHHLRIALVPRGSGHFFPQTLTRAMRLSTSKEQHQAGENRLSAHAMP